MPFSQQKHSSTTTLDFFQYASRLLLKIITQVIQIKLHFKFTFLIYF